MAQEGVDSSRIVFVGNVMIDPLMHALAPGLMLALGILGSFLFFGFVTNQTSARRTAETLTDSLRAPWSRWWPHCASFATRRRGRSRWRDALVERGTA